MKKLLALAITLAITAVAAAGAFAFLVASSQPGPAEDVDLIAVGNVTMTQTEGEVVSIGESSMTVRTNGGDVEIGCPTDSSQWLKSRAVVGDRVWVSYHADEDGTTSLRDVRVLPEG